MSVKPYPVMCRDCKYSKPEERSEWNLRCHNPVVNGKDAWALGGGTAHGSDCRSIRERSWPAKCGMRGALWEKK